MLYCRKEYFQVPQALNIYCPSSSALNLQIRFIQNLIRARGSALSARFKMFKDTKLSEISQGKGFYCFTDGKCQHAHFFFHPIMGFLPLPPPPKKKKKLLLQHNFEKQNTLRQQKLFHISLVSAAAPNHLYQFCVFTEQINR